MKEEWGWVVRRAWWMLRSDSTEDAIYVLLCIPGPTRVHLWLQVVPLSLKPSVSPFLGLGLSLVPQEPAQPWIEGSRDVLNDILGAWFFFITCAFWETQGNKLHVPSIISLAVNLGMVHLLTFSLPRTGWRGPGGREGAQL